MTPMGKGRRVTGQSLRLRMTEGQLAAQNGRITKKGIIPNYASGFIFMSLFVMI
jgi:hypothetical protein